MSLGKLSTLILKKEPPGWSPLGLACTGAGFLIAAGQKYLCVINTKSGEVVETITTAESCSLTGLALHEPDRAVYVTDSRFHQIKCIPLPDRYFVVGGSSGGSSGSDTKTATAAAPVPVPVSVPGTAVGTSQLEHAIRIADLESKLKAVQSELKATQNELADAKRSGKSYESEYKALLSIHLDDVKTAKEKSTAQTQQILVLTQHNAALTANLKAAESLAAASKVQAAGSGGSGGSGAGEAVRSVASISALQKEVTERPVTEWSAGAVIYWVERVFGAEHKSAQISEFVRELKSCAIGAASEVVGGQRFLSFKIKDLRALKLSDLDAIELVMESIDQLKDGIKRGQNIGSATGTGTGTGDQV